MSQSLSIKSIDNGLRTTVLSHLHGPKDEGPITKQHVTYHGIGRPFSIHVTNNLSWKSHVNDPNQSNGYRIHIVPHACDYQPSPLFKEESVPLNKYSNSFSFKHQFHSLTNLSIAGQPPLHHIISSEPPQQIMNPYFLIKSSSNIEQ